MEKEGWVSIPGTRAKPNPEGIKSCSPGLRVRELPWERAPNDPFSTPKELHPAGLVGRCHADARTGMRRRGVQL